MAGDIGEKEPLERSEKAEKADGLTDLQPVKKPEESSSEIQKEPQVSNLKPYEGQESIETHTEPKSSLLEPSDYELGTPKLADTGTSASQSSETGKSEFIEAHYLFIGCC